MASIEGLTEEHCQALAGAQIGDLILVQSYPKRAASEQSGEGSDNESERSQSDDGNTSTHINTVANDEASGDEDDGEGEGESEDENEGSESDEEAASEDGEEDRTTTKAVYLIHDLSKDEDGEIDCIKIREVSYCLTPADATSSNFHIYGRETELSHRIELFSTFHGIGAYNIRDVLDKDEATEYSIRLKPSGDDIRDILFHGRCPARCDDGWISGLEEMHALVTEPIRLLSTTYEPTCPVCIGKGLMQQHQALRELLHDTHQVDIGALVDFYGSLSIRRKALGYSFKQFDEREWGMVFDDMLSEDEDEDGPNGEYWEDYEEAQDPNANPEFHPASDAAIAALPQKAFGDLAKGEEDGACAICMTKFTDDAVVAELPCGHYYDLECAQKWLKTSNACPTCRKKLPAVDVPAADVPAAESTENERLAGVGAGNEVVGEELVIGDSDDKAEEESIGSNEEGEDDEDEDGEDDLDEVDDEEFKDALDTQPDEMDGEDVVMSGTEDVSLAV